jgi:serine protease Do
MEAEARRVARFLAQGHTPGPLAPPAAVGGAVDNGPNLRRTVVVDVAERTKNAVVYISADKLVQQRVSPFGNDPFWQQFDLPGMVQQRRASSLGSGFVVHSDGYIVTNNHVIDRALKIEVEFLDGQRFKGRLIASDPSADLAILKVDSDKPLPAIELGDSSDLMIGEPVIAVGNPVGLSHTVSTGIVSALHRDLRAEQDRDPDHPSALGDLIQTDAAINPGNSGGPLLNAYGQVIGINTAIRSDAQNIGFAIEVNRLRELIPQLMNPAQVTKVDVPLKFEEKRKISPPAQVETSLMTESGRPLVSIAGQKPRDIIDLQSFIRVQGSDEYD